MLSSSYKIGSIQCSSQLVTNCFTLGAEGFAAVAVAVAVDVVGAGVVADVAAHVVGTYDHIRVEHYC